jgi:hypothetical protein
MKRRSARPEKLMNATAVQHAGVPASERMMELLPDAMSCTSTVFGSGRNVQVSIVKTEVRAAVGRPHTFGWLRCSENDAIVSGSYFEAWERPDGGVVMIPRQQHEKPIEMIIALRKDGSVFVISPKGTAQSRSPSRSRV